MIVKTTCTCNSRYKVIAHHIGDIAIDPLVISVVAVIISTMQLVLHLTISIEVFIVGSLINQLVLIR